MSGVIKLGSTTFGTENNGKIDLTNVGGEANFTGTINTTGILAILGGS